MHSHKNNKSGWFLRSSLDHDIREWQSRNLLLLAQNKHPCTGTVWLNQGFASWWKHVKRDNNHLSVFFVTSLHCVPMKTLMHLSAAYQRQQNSWTDFSCELQQPLMLRFWPGTEASFLYSSWWGDWEGENRCWVCASAASCGFTHNNIACTGLWVSIDLRGYFFFPQI